MIRYILFALTALIATALPSAASLAGSVSSKNIDAGAAQVPNGARQARLETSNHRLELVARLRNKKLQIYVDHFATNEPLLNASVQVRVGKAEAGATFDPIEKEYEIADSTFLAALSKGGEHKLDFIINDSSTLSGSMSIVGDEVERSLLWLVALAVAAIVMLITGRAVGHRTVRETPSSREDREPRSYHGLCISCIAAVLTIGLYHSPVSADATLTSHDFETPSKFKADGLARLSDGTVNIPKRMQRLLGIQTLAVADTVSGLDLRPTARSLPLAVTSSPPPNVSAPSAPRALTDENIRRGNASAALPPESLVRNRHGLPIIWIKVSAERFGEAAVKFKGYRDGKAVIEGIPPNSRVVISGADLINQVR